MIPQMIPFSPKLSPNDSPFPQLIPLAGKCLEMSAFLLKFALSKGRKKPFGGAPFFLFRSPEKDSIERISDV